MASPLSRSLPVAARRLGVRRRQEIHDQLLALEEANDLACLREKAQAVAESCTRETVQQLNAAWERVKESEEAGPPEFEAMAAAATASFAAAGTVASGTGTPTGAFEDLAPFLRLWDAVAVAPQLDAPLAGECKAAAALVQPWLELRRAMRAAAHRATGTLVLEAVQKEQVLRRSLASRVGAADPEWAVALRTALETTWTQARPSLVASGQTVVAEARASLTRATAVLAQVAGGAAHGAFWWAEGRREGNQPPILEHFGYTLDKVRTEQIASALATTQSALEATQGLQAQLAPLGSWEELGGTAEDLDAAFEVTIRANMTKCELLCCRVLLRMPDKKTKLLKYTSEFCSNTKANWATVMAPELVLLVQAEINK